MLVHFKSKLSNVIGADGPVGSGVGVGVAAGVGFGDSVGVGFGFAIGFLCQTSLPLTFLQIRVPEVEFNVVHLEPNLAFAAWEIAGAPSIKQAPRIIERYLVLTKIPSQRWV